MNEDDLSAFVDKISLELSSLEEEEEMNFILNLLRLAVFRRKIDPILCITSVFEVLGMHIFRYNPQEKVH